MNIEGTKTELAEPSTIIYRHPQVEDGTDMWNLVRSTGVLDVNSLYSYYMLCRYYAKTCIVAVQNERMVGFVTAFCPPEDSKSLFIWQIAVDADVRGQGVGKGIIRHLLRSEACKQVRYVEATVSPSNIASQSLLKSTAKALKTECVVEDCFPANLFQGGNHEEENLYRIGPFELHETKGGK